MAEKAIPVAPEQKSEPASEPPRAGGYVLIDGRWVIESELATPPAE